MPLHASEWNFLGWESVVARKLRMWDVWTYSMADYSMSDGAPYGSLTPKEQANELTKARVEGISDPGITSEVYAVLKNRGGTWAAYQNVDLSSAGIGHIQFIKYGPGCTFERPPMKCPDTSSGGLGWRYAHVGYVDLVKGLVVEAEPA